jgi:uracil-DNA glycosylase family 4
VDHVADRARNPFGIEPPTDPPFDGDRPAVLGYGDPSADFHVAGDHPGVHGGLDDARGVPFTGPGNARFRAVLHAVGLLNGSGDDAAAENLFLSYVHPVAPPDGRDPTPAEYAAIERYFDAEFRAVNAHVVLPVGDRAFDHVLREYTARAARIEPDAAAHHATEVKGRGHIVIPVRDPADWTDADAEALERTLTDVLSRDYRQTSDLGRFIAGDEPYEVH